MKVGKHAPRPAAIPEPETAAASAPVAPRSRRSSFDAAFDVLLMHREVMKMSIVVDGETFIVARVAKTNGD